jgi:hypothetical protein
MTRFVEVVVPAKDQPRRGSDLQQAQRETSAARDLNKSAQQGRAAACFIGLHWAMNEFAEHCCLLLHNGVKPGPGGVTVAIATRRGITGSKLRRLALQHDAVDCPEKTQSKR